MTNDYLKETILTTSFNEINICNSNMVFQKGNDIQRDVIEYFSDALFIHLVKLKK